MAFAQSNDIRETKVVVLRGGSHHSRNIDLTVTLTTLELYVRWFGRLASAARCELAQSILQHEHLTSVSVCVCVAVCVHTNVDIKDWYLTNRQEKLDMHKQVEGPERIQGQTYTLADMQTPTSRHTNSYSSAFLVTMNTRDYLTCKHTF